MKSTSNVSPKETDSHQPKVLVIDDEPRVIEAIRRRLALYDLVVLEGFHGYQGIWRGITERPDVIITDVRMPHANGEEVIECLQRNPNTSNVPIFVLTGITEPGLERKLRHCGAAEFFSKPVKLDDLVNALSKYITMKHATIDSPVSDGLGGETGFLENAQP